MPDPIRIFEAQSVTALLAAAIVLLGVWIKRRNRVVPAALPALAGIAAGLFAGCWLLGLLPHWPPREDQDRFLLIVLPAVIAVEMLTALAGGWVKSVWLLRQVVAVGATPVLLYGSSYLSPSAGTGKAEWNTAQAGLILAALAAVLAGTWGSLLLLSHRSPGRSVPLAVALACVAAAVAIMLSGYASGGQLGFLIAAGIAGAVFASADAAKSSAGVSFGVIALFSLLVMGRFFGQLTTTNAALLFFAPLLSWLPELRFVRVVGPHFRGLLRLVATSILLAVAVALAQHQFVADSASPSGSAEPSVDDYMNFGSPAK